MSKSRTSFFTSHLLLRSTQEAIASRKHRELQRGGLGNHAEGYLQKDSVSWTQARDGVITFHCPYRCLYV